MAMANPRVLTLFDPNDNYQWCDTQFSNEIFIRKIEAEHCLNHVVDIRNTHPQLDLHLFFPGTQTGHIHNQQNYEDTIKYIYCEDEALISSIRRTYNRRFAHKIFTARDLEFEINHVQIALLRALAQQSPEDSPERNRFVLLAMGTVDIAWHILNQMKTDLSLSETSTEPFIERPNEQLTELLIQLTHEPLPEPTIGPSTVIPTEQR